MNELLSPTVEITKAAGAVIMEFFKSSFDVEDKSPDNPVTDADFAADKLLKERLMELLPEAGWLSEETVDNPMRLLKEYVWVVDPLDGTKEFVMGIPEFAVSVGLVQDGRPQIGVIFNPATDELFIAENKGGVTYNGEEVEVTDRPLVEGALVLASRTEWDRGEFEPFESLVENEIVGSIAYKLARVAAGQADATWSRGPKNEWDVCAGALMVVEAGGACVDLDDKDLFFNRPRPKVNGVIADNGKIHEAVMAALKPHGAARPLET